MKCIRASVAWGSEIAHLDLLLVRESEIAVEDLIDHFDQVAADRAADAAVVRDHDLLGRRELLLEQLVIDAHLAKLVLHHRDPAA